jgi:hypothetical protein
MYRFDVLLLPKCDVSEEATCCWHDVIKNKIQSYSDPLLDRWLDVPENVETLESALKRLIGDLEGFSPARVLAKLPPIANMPETARIGLAAKLHEAFEHGFGVAETRERLRAVVKSLKRALRDCTSGRNGSTRAEQLAALRAAASGVRSELEALPAGYWMPRFTAGDLG